LPQGVGIVLKDEKGRNGNIRPGSIVRHVRFRGFTRQITGFIHTNIIGTTTRRIGYEDGRRTRALGIPDFFDKITIAPINHQYEGCRPRFLIAVAVAIPFRITTSFVDLRTAQIGIGVIDLLRNGTTVRGNAK
jgi:hypothetical protein